MTVAFPTTQRFMPVSAGGPGIDPVAAFGNERFKIGKLGGVVGSSSRLGKRYQAPNGTETVARLIFNPAFSSRMSSW
jgi:hypothetical protein